MMFIAQWTDGSRLSEREPMVSIPKTNHRKFEASHKLDAISLQLGSVSNLYDPSKILKTLTPNASGEGMFDWATKQNVPYRARTIFARPVFGLASQINGVTSPHAAR